MKVVLEKRLGESVKAQIGLPVASALMALVFCGVFFALTGKDPLMVYDSMFSGALGNDYGLSETIVAGAVCFGHCRCLPYANLEHRRGRAVLHGRVCRNMGAA